MTDDDTARLRERTQQHVDFHMEMVYAAPRDILALLDALDAARAERDAALARAIPPGCVVVPAEPTKAMLAAADKIMDCDPRWVARGYRAMIGAAQGGGEG